MTYEEKEYFGINEMEFVKTIEKRIQKFEIIEASVEIPYKEREEIKEGISLKDENPVVVASFEYLEEAREYLSNYKSSITELSGYTGRYYLVEEYHIESNIYDEDGEFIEAGDIFEFSKMNIELVEKPSYDTLETLDNMKDAVRAYDMYEGEEEVFLHF